MAGGVGWASAPPHETAKQCRHRAWAFKPSLQKNEYVRPVGALSMLRRIPHAFKQWQCSGGESQIDYVSVKKVSLVIWHTVLFQDLDELFFEGHFAMVFFLTSDVCIHLVGH